MQTYAARTPSLPNVYRRSDCTDARTPKAVKIGLADRYFALRTNLLTLSLRSRLCLTNWPDSQMAFVRHMTLLLKYVPEAGVRAIDEMLPPSRLD